MQMPISFSGFVAQSDLTLLTCSTTACSHLNVIWRDRKGRLFITRLNGKAQPQSSPWETDTHACLAAQASQPKTAVCVGDHIV